MSLFYAFPTLFGLPPPLCFFPTPFSAPPSVSPLCFDTSGFAGDISSGFPEFYFEISLALQC